MQSRLAVLMVADMVGYTSLMDQDEAEAIKAVNALKESYLEPIIEKFGGEILKRMQSFPHFYSACPS